MKVNNPTSPDKLSLRRILLSNAASQAHRLADIAEQRARTAKAALKTAKKSAKQARKAAKKALKKAAKRDRQYQEFLKSLKSNAKKAVTAKPKKVVRAKAARTRVKAKGAATQKKHPVRHSTIVKPTRPQPSILPATPPTIPAPVQDNLAGPIGPLP